MLLGAIIGDIVGSRFEWENTKRKDFEFFTNRLEFTDDSVMTCAVAESLLFDYPVDYCMRRWYRMFPNVTYGKMFGEWCRQEIDGAYNSYGNGSAMRTSAIPYFCKTMEECKELSKKYAEATHNHPEGIKGAEAVSVAIWLALHRANKEEIKKYIEDNYYSLDFDYNDLVANYNTFEVSCQKSVPQAIYCFLISTDFEDCIRTAVSIGGDSDTIACIAGSIAEAYYGIPNWIKQGIKKYLSEDIYMLLKRVGDLD